jgi:hypothetical protein
MKNFTRLAAIAAFSLTFSLTVSANEINRPPSRSPRVYIMMRHGKLIEVNRGHRKLIKKDVILINETTIHPNGSIDAGSGQSLQLKEGEYITMDGRIRNLRNLTHPKS